MNHLSKTSEHLNRVDTKESLNSENISISAVPGNIVSFNLLDNETNESDLYTLKLVNHSKSNDNEISLESPIGKSIHNTHIGDKVSYTVNSNKFTLTILNIEIPA